MVVPNAFSDLHLVPSNRRNYLCLKNEELRHLRTGLALPDNELEIADVADVARSKDALSAAIRERYTAPPESPYEGEHANWMSTHGLRWKYHRYDLQIDPNSSMDALYQMPQDAVRPRTVMVGSGMSALYFSLLTISDSENSIRIAIPKDAYFETLRLTKYLMDTRRNVAWLGAPLGAQDAVVLILDSIGIKSHASVLDRDLAGAARQIVIFDTTCYDRRDPAIQALLQKALARRCIVILARSHQKIDAVGIPTPRIGTIALIGPQELSAYVEGLWRRLMQVLPLAGGFPSVESMAFFSLMSRFQSLNACRVMRLKTTTEMMVEELLHAGVGQRVVPYHHSCFFCLDLTAAELDATALLSDLRHLGLPVKRNSSFGGEQISFTEFYDVRRRRETVRIALPDLHLDAIPPAAAVFTRHLRQMPTARDG